jgi:ribosomal protein L11 methyltransferase
MPPTTWYEIRCLVPAAAADLLADELTQLTGNGVCTANLAVDTFSPETISEPETVCLLAYLSGDSDPAPVLDVIEGQLADLRRQSGAEIPRAACSTINEEDWANTWKAYFKPTRIGTHLIIKPSWETFNSEPGDLIIELDPGMAFGTGTHPTTRLCLEALERHLPSTGPMRSVLDVGTGSGVLAIAAALLGAAPITAVDIDPIAIDVARHNASQNGIGERIICSTTPLDELPGSYDLILANILAEDLVRMRHQLAARVANNGTLILSGILVEREELVSTGFADTPLTLLTTTRHGDWSCLEYGRPG